MNDTRAVWLPYRPEDFPGALPEQLEYHHWDGGAFPTDPAALRFLVPPPMSTDRSDLLSRLLPRARRLEVLQVLSSGHDYLRPHLGMLPAGAVVATGRGVHGEVTAELAVTLLLASARGLDHFLALQTTGKWRPHTFPTLSGKTVVVVGQGAVGSAVGARLAPFGCRVVRVARTARDTPDGRVHDVRDLSELLPHADAVVLCAPLTEETRGLLSDSRMNLMKEGALLVNVARGELVDTEALARQVERGRLRAALDVTAPEPLPAGHPLWHLPGVIITPHTGAFTDAFIPASLIFLHHQLRRYAAREALANLLPLPAGVA
ncbi:NAD(P)-dependent oxidoreductase [Streptomyces sp. NPDC086010]|uniref:NAD(P)-dependent oxidoreductase n=1 Tax=Streptomyces sp. NPDC086010 TaxID=3365745 RepID=UPI0037D36869